MANRTEKVHRITKTLYIVFFILGLLSLAFCLGGYTEQQYSLKAERDYQNAIYEYDDINTLDTFGRLEEIKEICKANEYKCESSCNCIYPQKSRAST